MAYKQIITELEEMIARLQQECTEKTDDIIALGKLLRVKGQECDKLKQTITEVKEIAEGMHDLWVNKTKYTDIDNLVKHLLECELNRIRYKLDEISEVENERNQI